LDREDDSLYEMPMYHDKNFLIKIGINALGKNGFFSGHRHEEIEFLYFIKGQAIVSCNAKKYSVKSGDLIVVNSNEVHSARSLTEEVSYYCIIVHNSILQSNIFDKCDVKYILPFKNKLLVFKNLIQDDFINSCINEIITENNNKNIGYELAIKSYIYNIFVLLLRNYVENFDVLNLYNIKTKKLDQLNNILRFIEENYMYTIKTGSISKQFNISTYYLCHLFKETLGQSLSEYTNKIRLDKASELLKTTNMTISEIAMITGFEDSGYFCRMFKKQYNCSPTFYRKSELH